MTEHFIVRPKRFVNWLLRHLADEGEIVKNMYRRLRYEMRIFCFRVKMIFLKYNIRDPDDIFMINTNRIIYHTNYKRDNKGQVKDHIFHKIKDRGRMYPGDWDLSSHKFTDLEIYEAFEQRMLHGREWEETRFYHSELASIKAGQMRWGCRNLEDWKKRCRQLDLLIQSVRVKGYIVEHNLTSASGSRGAFLKPEMSEEITVNIGRNGQYLFQSGRHRLAIAKILGIERIPIKVLVRHKEWQEFRETMISIAARNRRGRKGSNALYQPALHPDLNDIPSSHVCEDRFMAIKKILRLTSGTVLDVDANLCYFCHKLEDLGFDCYAIEGDLEIANAANKIRVAEGKNFTILMGNVFDSHIQRQTHQKHFDIVIALNIFHHFLKSKAIFTQFEKWLPRLNLKTMFFEPHLHNEEEMKDSYLDFTGEEFVRFILKNTTLNYFEIIHEAADGRRIYRLY